MIFSCLTECNLWNHYSNNMFVKKKTLSFEKTGLFSQLIIDFVNHEDNIKPFLTSFSTLESIESSLPVVGQDVRKDFVHVIEEQYEKTIFLNDASLEMKPHINSLLSANTYTVTTGHQLSIFASPLFLIYKIISTISYAHFLNKKLPDYNFVPCFWMATEDHDFKEINSCKFYNQEYLWELNHQDAIGNLSSDSILPTLHKMKKVLTQTVFGRELYDIYSFVYSNNQNYADATRSLLTTFFKKHGLIIVDGNHVNLKKRFINDFLFEINHNNIYNTVSSTNELISQKYKPQINALSANIFYLFDSFRSKIEFDGSNYFSVSHKKYWSKEELIDEINYHPERFSPNVFLRTLYQQRIMPNIMYVAGPSELSYWLQLKKTFAYVDINYPLLHLRSFFLLLSKKSLAFQIENQLTYEDLFSIQDSKIKKVLKNMLNLKEDLFRDEMSIFLSDIREKVTNLNFRMDSFFVFEKRVKKELLRLESKMIKSQKLKNKDLVNKCMSLHDEIFPNNVPQERINTFIPYYMKYGQDFFELLIKESSIFDNKYIILTEGT